MSSHTPHTHACTRIPLLTPLQFCPTNDGFAEFAGHLGFKGPNPTAQLLAAAKANPAPFKQVRRPTGLLHC